MSGECGPAGADPAEGRFQRPEGQVAAAQVGGAAGHPLRHLSHRGLRQGQLDREDAHPAPGGGKGRGSVSLRRSPVEEAQFRRNHPDSAAFLLSVKVEEVKRRQHCLMFSSAGSQAQTYFVNFDTLAEYQRWQRQASKV
ncbi:unnamed protein product, partial [Tetraodon nigroviridis]